MENEHIAKTYDIPDTEDLTSVDAALSLNKIHAAALADKKHPFWGRAHPQSKEFQVAVSRLHVIKSEAAQTAADKLLTDVDERKTSSQARLVREAQLLCDDMVTNHNFESMAVPGDVKAWQIRSWRMQKDLAKKDYTAVASGLLKELRELNADSETLSSVDSAMGEGGINGRYRDKFFLGLISDVLKVHKRRAANPSRNFGEQLHNFPKANSEAGGF